VAKTSSGFVGEVLHFGAVRLRVTGSGSLRMFINSLDSVEVDTLSAITMASTTATEPVALANLTSQRGQLQIQTTAIDETFTISRIIVFVKPVATGFPQ
jgi:hypothetical protein